MRRGSSFVFVSLQESIYLCRKYFPTMKKLRNIVLIAGAVIVVFALLVKFIPGFNVTEFAYGFCWGLGGTLLVAGLVLTASPLYCRKKKEETPAEPKK